MLHLCIHYKDVTLGINKDVARNKIPYLVGIVGVSSLCSCLLKSQCSHIGVNHHLGGRMGVGYSWLNNNRLYSTAIEACKTIKRIGGFREDKIVYQNLSKQGYNTAAVQKIIDFVDDIFCYVGVVLITTWTRNAQVENIHHRNPKAIGLSQLLSYSLLSLETAYICLAISKLRFMYCAKSFEFIGDCCDAAIFPPLPPCGTG